MDDRATYTFRVGRLSYAELWRLGKNPLGFLLLLPAKWFGSARFDQTDTSSFRSVLLTDPEIPAQLRPPLATARGQFTAQGFRYLGVDEEVLRANGCMATFVRGPVAAVQVISARSNYIALYSFPPDSRPIVTANGRNSIDNGPATMPLLLRRAPLAELLDRHAARIAPLGLPDLSDVALLDSFERLARAVRAHQVARGIFVPHPLVPPLLPVTRH